MPSDNLDKYIKENIEAVQHTPPPGINWDPEAAWLRMQQPPVLTRRKKANWLRYAAAIFVVGVLGGLTRQYWSSSPKATDSFVATTPAKEILPQTSKSNSIVEDVAEPHSSNINAIPISEQHKPEVVSVNKIKRSGKSLALPIGINKIKHTAVAEPTIAPDKQPTILLVEPNETAPSEAATLAGTTAQPLKITVVLGKTSTAKMLNQTANNNLPAKRRETRLRLHLPSPENLDKGHLASTDSAYQPLKLQARIDL